MWRGMLLAAMLVASSGLTALAAGGSGNSANDSLLAMSPQQQAKELSHGIKGCAGISAFPMGVVSTGKWKSLAYWSVRCKDGRSFAIQIAPTSQIFVVDCQTFQANGKECFKKF